MPYAQDVARRALLFLLTQSRAVFYRQAVKFRERRRITMPKLVVVTLVLLVLGLSDPAPGLPQARDKGETKVNRDPKAARLVTSDIEHFWKAYDVAKPENRLEVFNREYFGKGSDGLKAFKQLRIDQCDFIRTLATHPRYYASIRESTLKVKSMERPIRASCLRSGCIRLTGTKAVSNGVYKNRCHKLPGLR